MQNEYMVKHLFWHVDLSAAATMYYFMARVASKSRVLGTMLLGLFSALLLPCTVSWLVVASNSTVVGIWFKKAQRVMYLLEKAFSCW
jgi:hypothetical protein